MARQIINVGAAPNDGTGDPIRTAYIKCNDNFGELYSRAQTNPPATLIGTVGDEAGMYAYDSTYFYYCFQDYDGSSVIWAEVTNVGNIAIPQIINGTSLVDISSTNGNVSVTVAGSSNVAVFTTTGITAANATVSGVLSTVGNTAMRHVLPSANGTFDLGSSSLQWRDLYVGGNSIYLGSAQLRSNATSLILTAPGGGNFVVDGATGNAETVNATGNITGANLFTPGTVSATGNIICQNGIFIGNGSGLTGVVATSNVGAAVKLENGSTEINILGAGGNIVANVSGVTNVLTLTSTGVDLLGNITASNITTTGLIAATANVTGGNLRATAMVTAGGNITGGNVLSSGIISATGNITGGNLSVTNIIGSLTTATQTNITSVGTLNSLSVVGNITAGNVAANNFSSTLITGTLTTAAQPNITSLGVLTAVSCSGNISSDRIFGGLEVNASLFSGVNASLTGNILSAGIISTVGNVTGNFFIGNGSQLTGVVATGIGVLTSLSVTGNIDSGNLRTTGQVSAVGNLTGSNLSVSTGTVSAGNIVNTNSNGVGNIGTTSTRFNTVFAVATSALYADLAEYYLSDAAYAPGTVVSFDGIEEITRCDRDHDPVVAGVVSEQPAYEMNAGLQGDHVLPVALVGRVRCLVRGPVRRGQMMVSAGAGHARAEISPDIGTVIGKALQDCDGESGMIEVVVGRL